MKLTLIAVGSRGDVQPIIALGKGLQQAGYAVRLVTLASFEGFVGGHGLDFSPVRGDAQQLVQEMMAKRGGNTNLLKMYRGIMRTFGAITDSYIEAFSAEALRDSDAILSQLPGGFFGYDLAQALDVPYLALSVIPQQSTASYPYALLPGQISLGRWWNRRSYDLAAQLVWPPFRKPINQFRRRLGLPRASFWWGSTRAVYPVLQGFSEHVVPTEPDWGAHMHTTGYWLLDESDWEPSAELEQFLAAGEPPVFIGFGSMPVPDSAKTTQIILDALAETGQRAVLSAGWAGLGAQRLPEHVFLLDYAPYTWLFPKMRGIVHHGGSGTTGLALRSGAPSVVIPFTADQPFWGERTRALGVGPAPVLFQNLSVPNLAVAIQTMLTDKAMQQRAGEMRQKLLAEDGVKTAVKIVQSILA
ncbi:MAG: glycosyltransferase family 1 protein [Anaerolineales bacterium]|nr:glycosyltransferase family 1 protein [Anaerolineales bacterium]